MKSVQVAKLSPVERLFYWMQERHRIYQLRSQGRKKPWTDDEVLQQYFFTNPYRENDKTTQWFREEIREPLRDDPIVAFATICFRWFNLIETGWVLLDNDLIENWRSRVAIAALKDRKPVFTGAFIVKSPIGEKKLPGICRMISNVWSKRDWLAGCIEGCTTLETAWECIRAFPYLGKFTAYEVVTDLRYTYLLEDATDVNTWCNLGPGARRGLMRLMGKTPPKNKRGREKAGIGLPLDWRERMIDLLEQAREAMPSMPLLEMREIEHSLCELDKYERMRLGQGRSKRKYAGV